MRVKGHRAALSEYRENPQERRLYATRTGFVMCTSEDIPEADGLERIDNRIKDYYGIPGHAITETMIRVMVGKIFKEEANKWGCLILG